MMSKVGVITNQEEFFNRNSKTSKQFFLSQVFYDYINREQILCFASLEGARTILEYGCGTGMSIDLYSKYRNFKQDGVQIIGVDIAKDATKEAQKKYPDFKFYKIDNNKIPQLEDSSMDGAYMVHVLHHAKGHQQIFDEIFRKLKPEGVFFLNDLTSNNPFVKLGRLVFAFVPKFIKSKFSKDDLVVDGKIPEKYKVGVEKVLTQLKKSGFKVEKVGFGHLFCFLIAWFEKFVPLSKFSPIRWLYKALMSFESYLLNFRIFQKRAEVFYVICKK